jgi:hypothetical protein
MKRFSVGQRWVSEDAMWGRFLAEVVDIADKDRQGTVVITDGIVTCWIPSAVLLPRFRLPASGN